MKIAQNTLFLFGIVFLFLGAKCHSKLKLKTNPKFQVVEAFSQIQVLGQEAEKENLVIGITLKNYTEDFVIDSIYYQQKSALKMFQQKSFWRAIIRYKKPFKIENFEGYSLKDKIILFYSDNRKSYFTILENVEKKETVYLP